MMKKFFLRCLLVIFFSFGLVFAGDFEDSVIQHDHNEDFLKIFWEENPFADKEQIGKLLDEHLRDFLRSLKNLPVNNRRKIQLKNLSAALGHSKRRAGLIFRSTDVQVQARAPFKEILPRHDKFKDSLRAVMIRWLSEPQFSRDEQDIAWRLEKIFQVNPFPLQRDNETVPQKSIVVYPDQAHQLMRYYNWHTVVRADRIHSLRLISVEGGYNPKNVFGHSALLIVMCAAGTEINDECLKNKTDHLVLTFRAEVPAGTRLNPLKAALGHYPAHAFLTPWLEFSALYDKESRSILNIPLDLNRHQIELFVNQLSRVISQEQPYEFFSSNCATLILGLFLQSTMDEPELFKAFPLSPDGVIGAVIKAGLIGLEWPHKKHKAIDLLIKYIAKNSEIFSDEISMVDAAKEFAKIGGLDELQRIKKNRNAVDLLVQKILEKDAFGTEKFSIEALNRAALRAGLIKVEWPLKKNRTADLIILETEGLAFVPSKAKLRYHFKKMKEILMDIGMPLRLKTEDFSGYNAEARFSLYEIILKSIHNSLFVESALNDANQLIFLMSKIEDGIRIKLNNQLSEQAAEQFKTANPDSLSEDQVDFFASENEQVKILEAVLIKSREVGNIENIATMVELEKWENEEKEVRQRLTKNFLNKRKMSLPAKDELDIQDQIIHFLRMQSEQLNKPQDPPPKPTDNDPDDNIDDAHDEANTPPLIEFNVARAE